MKLDFFIKITFLLLPLKLHSECVCFSNLLRSIDRIVNNHGLIELNCSSAGIYCISCPVHGLPLARQLISSTQVVCFIVGSITVSGVVIYICVLSTHMTVQSRCRFVIALAACILCGEEQCIMGGGGTGGEKTATQR